MAGQKQDPDAIFHAAMEVSDPEARQAFLEKACGKDRALRRRIEALIKADSESAEFFGREEVRRTGPGSEAQGKSDPAPRQTEGPGATIGPYKLLEQIGEGGFGVVYMAEQKQPVKRRVALKIIKLGMDTRQVVARFEAERQALALMDHPNIAKVLDAGATDTGRPYFVMELVRGIPITRFCDEHGLATEQRLRLFIEVCHAVHHAHQKGIIHRDLKPSNILVTVHDDQPVVKVIDFGVAKATQQELTEKTHFTRFHEFIGTPAYMSPEQAEMSGLDIDTRSDIYSLGVLLYELLTGQTPFDEKDLLCAGYDEIRRQIREVEPLRPSTRVSQLPLLTLTAVARRRHCAPERLKGLIRGELDWVIMKALEKDRARRYESASAFAQDIQRKLNHQPVAAAAPSALYHFRKYARRNRGLLISLGAVATVLVLGTVISVWQAVRATRAERLARERLEATQTARESAEQSRIEAEAARAQADRARREAEDARLQSQVRELNSRSILYLNQRRYEQAKAVLFEAIALQPQDWGSLAILEKMPHYILLKHPLLADSQHDPAGWRYLLTTPPEGWTDLEFDDSDWPTGLAGFGHGEPYLPRTVWDTHDIWIRREFHLDSVPAGAWAFRVNHDDAVEVHLNGTLAAVSKLWSRGDYMMVPCLPEARAALRTGRNVLAVHCHNHLGTGFIDVGIHLVTGLEAQGSWVSDTLTYLITAHPEKHFIRRFRGSSHARQGDLAAALRDFRALIALEAGNHYDFFRAAPLFLLLGDADGYRQHCVAMVERFRHTNSPLVAERIAKACLLGAGSGRPEPGVQALVQRALGVGPRDWLTPFAQSTAALAAYRRSEFGETLSLASASLAYRPDPQNLYLTLASHLLSALAHQRLTDPAKARLSLEEARSLIEARLPSEPNADHGDYWHDWLICRLLLAEAEGLIKHAAPTAPEPR